jgi:hypothetical protein
MLNLTEVVLTQNYFTFQNKIYQPEKGISMGSPISGITAEIFLQHFEDKYVKHFLDSKNIVFYTCYVDDTLILYDTQKIHHSTITAYINQIHVNLTFNPTYELNTYTHYLDITVTQKPMQLEIDIFRKPTSIDTTINYCSNHPTEHKITAFRYDIIDYTTSHLHKERKTTNGTPYKALQ